MTEIYLDLETTGLSAYKNGIWQIAAIIFQGGQEVRTFECKCSIFPNQKMDAKALEMNDLTKEKVRGFQPAEEAYKDFVAMLKAYVDPYNKRDKMTMYGYNVRFDSDFLRQFFYNNNNRYFGSWFFFPPIDIMNLAADKLKHERANLKNFKQGTVAKHLGLEVDEDRLHDALYDIQISRQIYEELSKR
jgi:DNA polymerase-3 subunit epsilon